MKIKKIETLKNKLLILKLIQTKTYKQNSNNKALKLNDISFNLKKMLRIIYKYHINAKKILFIGIPLPTAQKIKYFLKNTGHIFIPESNWINSILLNKNSCFKHLKKRKIKKDFSLKKSNKISSTIPTLFELKKKIDIVVVLNPKVDYQALNESYKTRLPIITVTDNINKKSTYNLPGNFKFSKKKIGNNFFFSMLLATFKKANQHKIKLKSFSTKLSIHGKKF